MKFTRFALLAAAALFVAACLPVTTKTPIGQTVGFKADPALIGTWGQGEKDSYITFTDNGDGTMTEFIFSPDDDKGGEVYSLKAATLGRNHFMNARLVLVDGRPIRGDVSQMLYRIRNGALTLSSLDEEKVKLAIGSGRIAGTIDPGDDGDVHITAEPVAQDAFFATREGAALFSNRGEPLHRIN